MPHKYDVAIIGGGIVGNAIARELSKYELSAVLIDKEIEVSFGTSKANSGIIHSGIHDSPKTLKGRLCMQGNALWGDLSNELRIPFNRVGELLAARSRDDMPALERLFENARTNGVSAEFVAGKKLKEMEPNLAENIETALFAPSAGVIPPYEMTYALYENACQNGVEYLLGSKVTSIRRDGTGFIVTAGANELRSEYIINAAGVWADEVARSVGADNFTIKPRKGEEYLLDRRLNNINNHIIFPAPQPNSKGVLVIKTIEGSTMIGPTAVDTDDREDLSTTEEGLKKILDFVRTLVPGIDRNDIIASFAGMRPVSDTNDFMIEESRAVPHFINAAGIQSPGLTAAPAIALMIIQILGNGSLRLEKKKGWKKYDKPHRRLTLLSDREREDILKLNRNYGNIVCRCETVSEAEVVDAINRGAKTVDGVKFRTRAGMGRCQAGFCTHHVMRILSRELGIPEEKITKRGGGSNMIEGKR